MAAQKKSRSKMLDEQDNFAAWKEKKDEEARLRRRHEMEMRRQEAEDRRAKRINGQEAYSRWKSDREQRHRQQEADQRKLRYATVAVERDQILERERDAKATYDFWLERKELQRIALRSRDSARASRSAMFSDDTDGLLPGRAPTPTHGSFCSVWSCDMTLASRLQHQSPRTDVPDKLPYILRNRVEIGHGDPRERGSRSMRTQSQYRNVGNLQSSSLRDTHSKYLNKTF